MEKELLFNQIAEEIRKTWGVHFHASVIDGEIHVYLRAVNVAQTGRDNLIFSIDKAVAARLAQLINEKRVQNGQSAYFIRQF